MTIPLRVGPLGVRAGASLAVVIALCGCSPTLNWRETTYDATGVTTTFPCRPDRHARAVEVAGAVVQMEMLVCEAGDANYAVGFFDVGEPARVGPTLEALRTVMTLNVHGGEPRSTPLAIKGMTFNDQSSRFAVTGRRPDGSSLSVQAAFFSRGLRVYQAVVIGSKLSEESVEPFFSGLRFPG